MSPPETSSCSGDDGNFAVECEAHSSSPWGRVLTIVVGYGRRLQDGERIHGCPARPRYGQRGRDEKELPPVQFGTDLGEPLEVE